MTVEKPPRLTFYPFAYALLTDELCSYCWYCLKAIKEKKRCLGCGLALFCNKECQQLGWKDHKAECNGLKKCTTLPDIETRLLGRIVMRQKDIVSGKDKKDADFYKDRQSTRSIMEIWAHTDRMKKDHYAMTKFENLYARLIQFYDPKYLLTKDQVFELHCRDYINRHAISDVSYLKEIGKGLYLDLCAYDHSCRPNTIYTCSGFVATLRGLNSSVNINDKSTTFYAYVDLLCSQQERKKQLKDTWYFDCECERCIDSGDHVLSSVICPKCPDGTRTRISIFNTPPYKLPSEEITCPQCKEDVPKDYVMDCINTMRFIDRIISDRELEQMPVKGRVEFLQDLLDRFQHSLPNINVYLCRVVQHLIPLINPKDHKELLRLHLLSEECVRHCFPPNHPAVAFHVRNIGMFYLGLKDREMALKNIREAQRILEYTLDADHPMSIQNSEILDGAMYVPFESQKVEIPLNPEPVCSGDCKTAEEHAEHSDSPLQPSLKWQQLEEETGKILLKEHIEEQLARNDPAIEKKKNKKVKDAAKKAAKAAAASEPPTAPEPNDKSKAAILSPSAPTTTVVADTNGKEATAVPVVTAVHEPSIKDSNGRASPVNELLENARKLLSDLSDNFDDLPELVE